MAAGELHSLIAESRALRAELRIHLAFRRALARDFRSRLNRAAGVAVDETRIVQMTALILEAHQIALRDENGLTIDLVTDALTHLSGRLEREVLPRYE